MLNCIAAMNVACHDGLVWCYDCILSDKMSCVVFDKNFVDDVCVDWIKYKVVGYVMVQGKVSRLGKMASAFKAWPRPNLMQKWGFLLMKKMTMESHARIKMQLELGFRSWRK